MLESPTGSSRLTKPWRRRGGGLLLQHGIASRNAHFGPRWKKELRPVTGEMKNPRVTGGSVRRWSGKRDLNRIEGER
jgi:hypothetical protein